MGDLWDKVKNATSVADLVIKLLQDDSKPAPRTPTTPSKPRPRAPASNTTISDLEYLYPPVKKAARLALDECQRAGYVVKVVETLRTFTRQASLYEQGRSLAGGVVTQAKAGQSYHNYGLALDISPTNEAIAAIFEKYGFEWGARWKSFKDYPHFQITFGLSVSQLNGLYEQGGLSNVWKNIPA